MVVVMTLLDTSIVLLYIQQKGFRNIFVQFLLLHKVFDFLISCAFQANVFFIILME